MNEFYYQIKGLNAEGSWSWPPLHAGKVEAENSKVARRQLEEEFGVKLPGKKVGDIPFLLTLIDLKDKIYLRQRFDTRKCRQCDIEYTLNDKYMLNAGGQSDFCSMDCTSKFKVNEGQIFNVNFDFNGIHDPVIYKITSRSTGLCYIGKTTQAFTLRWYQHIYQGGGTKFHAAIKQFGIMDWTFEVIEIVKCDRLELKTKILERESYWMRHFDSVSNGYNSIISVAEKEEAEDEFQLALFNEETRPAH